jgi:hypothetical protein
MTIDVEALRGKLRKAMPCFDCDGDGDVDDMDSVGCGDRSCCSPARMHCSYCNGTGMDATARELLRIYAAWQGAADARVRGQGHSWAAGGTTTFEFDGMLEGSLIGRRVKLVPVEG